MPEFSNIQGRPQDGEEIVSMDSKKFHARLAGFQAARG